MIAYLYLLYLLYLLSRVDIICATELFAGNGLQTYAHTILHNRIINTNCTTYNDCYTLLCSYIIQPVYLVIIKPNYWNGNCHGVNMNDTRLLDAEIDIYNGNVNKTYYTKTLSGASHLLCKLNNNTNKIQYFIFNCTF